MGRRWQCTLYGVFIERRTISEVNLHPHIECNSFVSFNQDGMRLYIRRWVSVIYSCLQSRMQISDNSRTTYPMSCIEVCLQFQCRCNFHIHYYLMRTLSVFFFFSLLKSLYGWSREFGSTEERTIFMKQTFIFLENYSKCKFFLQKCTNPLAMGKNYDPNICKLLIPVMWQWNTHFQIKL